MTIDIIQVASILGALSVILGMIIGGYKYIDGQRRANEQNAAELQRFKEQQAAENKRYKKELTLLCEGVSACLDGIEQLGANHTVPKAKEKLNDYLNEAAHD